MTRRQKPHFTDRARTLRSGQTDAESLMWYALCDRRLEGLKFRRQYPIEPCIVDFACVEHHVIIEIDGDYHEYVDERDQVHTSVHILGQDDYSGQIVRIRHRRDRLRKFADTGS